MAMTIRKTLSGAAAIAIVAVAALSCGRTPSKDPQKVQEHTAVPTITFHDETLPFTTGPQVDEMEKKLSEIGFTKCWFKSGAGMGAYSLVGKFENVDFRISVTVETDPPKITATLSGVSSPEEKKAAQKFIEYLTAPKQDNVGQQSSAGDAATRAAPEK